MPLFFFMAGCALAYGVWLAAELARFRERQARETEAKRIAAEIYMWGELDGFR